MFTTYNFDFHSWAFLSTWAWANVPVFTEVASSHDFLLTHSKMLHTPLPLPANACPCTVMPLLTNLASIVPPWAHLPMLQTRGVPLCLFHESASFCLRYCCHSRLVSNCRLLPSTTDIFRRAVQVACLIVDCFMQLNASIPCWMAGSATFQDGSWDLRITFCLQSGSCSCS